MAKVIRAMRPTPSLSSLHGVWCGGVLMCVGRGGLRAHKRPGVLEHAAA